MEILNNELFQYSFFTNAMLAALFASITCGIIGTYIVSRRIVFISGGITHASFGGIGIAYYIGINPIVGAALFSIFSALGIEYITKQSDIRQDSAIGIWWSFGMAIGIIFIYLTPGYAPNLMSYLFGSILNVSLYNLLFMGGMVIVLIVFFTVFYRFILFISFDETYAKTHRLPVNLMNYILMILVGLTVVLNIRIVGIILVLSLLTIPQTIANLFVKKFRSIMIYAILISFIGSLSGLFISYALDIPSGATIIFSLVLLFILARGILALTRFIRFRIS